MKKTKIEVKAWAILNDGELDWNCGTSFPTITTEDHLWDECLDTSQTIVPCIISYEIPETV